MEKRYKLNLIKGYFCVLGLLGIIFSLVYYGSLRFLFFNFYSYACVFMIFRIDKKLRTEEVQER